MHKQPLVTRRHIEHWLRALLILVLVAAAVNVPFAVARLRSRTGKRPSNRLILQGPAAARPWPAATPHWQPWPTPNQFEEYRAFGIREYQVHAPGATAGQNGFQMEVQMTGWPLPVLEQKQMWWNWNDPKLKGPEPDPALLLRPDGLVFNPVILGTAAFVCLVGPHAAFIVLRRALRRKLGCCIDCGYQIRTDSKKCPECGAKHVSGPPQATTA